MGKRLNSPVFELGDSAEVLKEYDSDLVHLVWTSPPYLNQRLGDEKPEWDSLEGYLKSMASIMGQCIRILRPAHVLAINIGKDTTCDLTAFFSCMLADFGLKYIDTICWDRHQATGTPRSWHMKDGRYYPSLTWEPILIYQKPPLTDTVGRPLSKDEFPEFEFADLPFIESMCGTNLWTVAAQEDRNNWHPASFPLTLAKSIIRCYTKRGQYVLDPFGGSGTTGKAAVELGRDYLLVERVEEYYNKAVKELSSMNLGLGL
jgi:DNA modification methylase